MCVCVIQSFKILNNMTIYLNNMTPITQLNRTNKIFVYTALHFTLNEAYPDKASYSSSFQVVNI
jgi:hypothetical protein